MSHRGLPWSTGDSGNPGLRRGSPAPGRLRPLGLPSHLRVRTDAEGVPVALRRERGWRGVAAVRERWRIDDEWWRTPIHRDYFDLVLEDGRILVLYRDLESGAWFSQGPGP